MVIKLQIFMIKKILKVDSNHTYLAIISLHFALKKDESYYPQVFLKKCKYIEKRVIRHINDNLKGFFLMMILMKNLCFLINTYVSCLFSLLLLHKHAYKV